MGVGLAIMGLSGIVIGTDSQVNLGHSNIRYESNLKVFPFGASKEFGVFYSGDSHLLGIPPSILIEECNEHLKQQSLQIENPSAASLFLLNFYQSSLDYFQVKQDILIDLFQGFLEFSIKIELDLNDASDEELIALLSKLNIEASKEESNFGAVRLDLYFTKKELTKIRNENRLRILEQLGLKISTKAYNVMFAAMSRTDIFNGRLIFNIVGFDVTSPYPSLSTLRLFGFVAGKILYNKEVISTSSDHPVQYVVDGEFKFIDRFIGGADFSILNQYTSFYVDTLIKFLEESETNFSNQIEYLKAVKPDLVEEFQLSDTMYNLQNGEDFLNFLTNLSHQEIINVTYELVRMTIMLSQYDFKGYKRSGESGGQVTLGVIKKHQPFQYIQRGNL